MTWSRVICSMRQVRGAEEEDLARAALVDHLLVEFADAAGRLAAEEDAVEAAVGDGAGVDDGDASGVAARADDAGRRGPR